MVVRNPTLVRFIHIITIRRKQRAYASADDDAAPAFRRPHLKVSRSSTHTTASVVAATVAVRGHEYISDTSPKQSPRSFRFTLKFTPCRRCRTCAGAGGGRPPRGEGGG